MGQGTRSILRMSGSDSWSIVERASGRILPREHGVQRCRLLQGRFPCLLMRFPEPSSLTGEDVLEIMMTGGRSAAARVQDHLESLGARRAGPGEFSARAFMNGKMSIDQAESVAQSIAACTDAELAGARLVSEGEFAAQIRRIANDLADALALLEAGIDFTDQEDVISISAKDLSRRVVHAIGEIEALLSRSTVLAAGGDCPLVALIGPANAGKSSLFNALLGRQRAVVSDVCGTTRDVLIEPVTLGGSVEGLPGPKILLADTAGLDESDPTELNCALQRASRGALAAADIRVYLLPPGPLSHDVATGLMTPDVIMVRSKCDLSSSVGDANISSTSGEGLRWLSREIVQRLQRLACSRFAGRLVITHRHLRCAEEAVDELRQLTARLRGQSDRELIETTEIVAIGIRRSLNALGEVIGNISPDDIIGRIFCRFCIGK